MNHKELTNLLIKVAGAVIIIYQLINLPTYFSNFFALGLVEESAKQFLFIAAVPFFIPLIVGLLLFFFPSTITNKLVSQSSEPIGNNEITHHLQMVAFGVLGMYLLFYVVSDFVYNLSSLYLVEKPMMEGSPYLTDTYARILSTIAELIFAMYLLLGNKSLSILLNKFRKLGS